jgi:protein-tyrosine-phosphatase
MRSPYAEGVLRHLLGPRPRAQVSSAGFIGPDRPAPPIVVDGATHRGVDLRAHRSRVVTAVILDEADLVLVMDVDQLRALRRRFGIKGKVVVVLGDLDPRPLATRAIEDPVNQSSEVLDAVYARIDRCLAELVRSLARPEPDVAAPAGPLRYGSR